MISQYTYQEHVAKGTCYKNGKQHYYGPSIFPEIFRFRSIFSTKILPYIFIYHRTVFDHHFSLEIVGKLDGCTLKLMTNVSRYLDDWDKFGVKWVLQKNDGVIQSVYRDDWFVTRDTPLAHYFLKYYIISTLTIFSMNVLRRFSFFECWK